MSVMCGRPTPTGLCRRPVAAAGAPCGVTHPPLVSPAGASPSGTFQAGPGVEPLGTRVWHDEPGGVSWLAPVEGPAGTALSAAVEPPDSGGVWEWRVELEIAAGDDSYVTMGHGAGPGEGSAAAKAAAEELLGRVTSGRYSPDELAVLAAEDPTADRDLWWGRFVAAAHPATPPAALAALTADPNDYVAGVACANPSCPVGALTDVCERFLAGPHSDTDEDLYWYDKSRYAAEGAAANPRLPGDVAARCAANPLLAPWAARNQSTPPAALDAAARAVPAAAYWVALNPSSSPETLAWLSTHPDPSVREATISNPATPAAARAAAGLLADPDPAPF